MAVASCSETLQEFQAKHWLGRFWTEGLFQVVLIGARKSVASPLLENILGEQDDSRARCLKQPSLRDSIRSTASDHFVENDADFGAIRVRSYLVPSPSDAKGYKKERYIRKVRSFIANAQLVIYCIDMSATRLHASVLRTFQELTPDWNRTIIVLTFADALPLLMRHRDNPRFCKSQHFNKQLDEWTRELKAMLEGIGVEQEIATNIEICPVAERPQDFLPNGKHWLPPLSLAIMKILSPKKKAMFMEEHKELLHALTASTIQPATPSPTLDSRDVQVSMPLRSDERADSEVQLNSEGYLQDSVSSVLTEDQSQSIRAALSELRKDCPKFGVLVIGRTGAGKSTLINNLLGKQVAHVGHTLQSETPAVKVHEVEVEGVPIVVYDTPGLGDIKGKEEEQRHLEIMKGILKQKKVHLVVYCFQMNETTMTSSIVGTFHKYHQIGVEWKRSVIALTFADALYVPKSEQPLAISQAQYFDEQLEFWQKELRKLKESLGVPRICSCRQSLVCCQRSLTSELDAEDVEPDVAQLLQICPTSLLPKDHLPNGNPWYVPFWLHIVMILSPAAAAQFLGIHCNNICDQQAPPLSRCPEVVVELSEDEKDRFFNNIVTIFNAAKIDSKVVIPELARLDKAEVQHLLVGKDSSEVNSVPSLRELLKLFIPEQADRSGGEPFQDQEAVVYYNPIADRSGSEPNQDQVAVQCFKSFEECFIKKVQSKNNVPFTGKLCRHGVIPKSLRNQIDTAADNETANNYLYEHLCEQVDFETLAQLVAALIEAEGYPAMNKLGKEIEIALGLSAPSPERPMETAV